MSDATIPVPFASTKLRSPRASTEAAEEWLPPNWPDYRALLRTLRDAVVNQARVGQCRNVRLTGRCIQHRWHQDCPECEAVDRLAAATKAAFEATP